MHILLYPNRQTVVRQMLEINMKALSLSSEKFVFVHFSEHTFGKVEEILGDRLYASVDCLIDDSMTYSQLTDKLHELVHKLRGFKKSVDELGIRQRLGVKSMTSVVGYIMQDGDSQELLYNKIIDALDEHDDIPICKILKTASPSIHIVDYIAIVWLLKALEPEVFNNIIDDPLQAKFAWYTGKMNNLYYHKLSNDNELVSKYNFRYCPYPIYSLFNLELNTACEQKYLFTVGMTDYIVGNGRSEILNELLNTFGDKEDCNIYYVSNDENLKSKWTEKNKILPYFDYMNVIKHSRFTLIIPSYHNGVWSNKRFYEAVLNGCLPIILDTDNRLAEGLDFDIELITLCKQLTINMSDIKNLYDICSSLTETERKNILKELHNSARFKSLKSAEYHKKYIDMYIK